MTLPFSGTVDALAPPLRLEVPVKCLPLVNTPKRFNVLRGGRGSAKSRTVARLLLCLGVSTVRRVLCTREIQKSMKDSVHRLLSDEIQRLGLGQFYEVLETEIRGRNGTLFLFAGLQGHTVETLKSYEGVTDVWIEEASAVSERSWEILIPTIRAPGSKFWITFNPDLESDPVWQRFVVNPPPPERCQVIELNYSDNPWFEDTELVEESAELRRKFPVVWEHVYGGKLRSATGLIFKRKWARYYDPAQANVLPVGMRFYMASDYATTDDGGDYTVHVVFGLDHLDQLWLVDLWHGQTNPTEWTDAALDLVEKWRPIYWFEEKGAILNAVSGSINVRMMQRAAQRRPAYVVRFPLASIGSKRSRAMGINSTRPNPADQARAMGFAGRMSAGAVLFPTTGPGREWVTWLTDQLWAFHGLGGQVDDGTDACSLLARGLDAMARGDEPPPPDPEMAPQFSDPWFKARDKIRAGTDDKDRGEFYN